MTPKELADEIARLAEKATPGPVRSMRDGNQYIKTQYIPTATLVGASRVDGLKRPWNPHSAMAFGMKAEAHEVVRLLDADADLLEKLWNNVDLILSALRRADAVEGAKVALTGMLAHSCVADTAGEDKDAEDHEAERVARTALTHLEKL